MGFVVMTGGVGVDDPRGSGGPRGQGGSGGTCSIVGGTRAVGSSSFMAWSSRRNHRTGGRKVKVVVGCS
jgi:hypothetical protein